MELTKHSSYKKQYHSHRKSPDMLSNSFNLETIHHNKGKPSQVIALSSYLSSFGSRPTPSPERHRPDDLLKFKGPTSSFSSYAKEYPSFKNNRSPYVHIPLFRSNRLNHIYKNLLKWALQSTSHSSMTPTRDLLKLGRDPTT